MRYEDQGEGAYQFLTQKIGDDVTNAEYLNPCDFLGDSAMKVVEFCLENGLDSELGIFNPNLHATHRAWVVLGDLLRGGIFGEMPPPVGGGKL